MKKGLLLVALSAIFFSAQSQVNFGVKAGLNIANITGDDLYDEGKSLLGPNIGVFVELPVASNFSVKPEVYYSAQGSKEKYSGSGGTVTTKLALGYINIPVLAKYTTESGFFAETGPQLGILASAKSKLKGDFEGEEDSSTEDIKEYLKSTDFGWAFGIGYQLASGLGFNARYNLGLNDLPKDSDGKGKNTVIQVGLFYNFGGGSK